METIEEGEGGGEDAREGSEGAVVGGIQRERAEMATQRTNFVEGQVTRIKRENQAESFNLVVIKERRATLKTRKRKLVTSKVVNAAQSVLLRIIWNCTSLTNRVTVTSTYRILGHKEDAH